MDIIFYTEYSIKKRVRKGIKLYTCTREKFSVSPQTLADSIYPAREIPTLLSSKNNVLYFGDRF